MPSADRDLNADDALEDFDHRELTFLGKTKTVFVSGSGPAVIVMPEIPGIHPYVARFARWVRDAGFTVLMPNLFGEPGRAYSIPRVRGVLVRVCVGREFRALAANRSTRSSTGCARWRRTRTRSAAGAALARSACASPGTSRSR